MSEAGATIRQTVAMSPRSARVAPGPNGHTTDELEGRVALVAAYLVDSGKVVPSLVLEDGSAESRWVPLPGMGDRDLLTCLVEEDTVEGHRRAARALAAAVDRLARQRLSGSGLRLVARRSGRRTVPQAWLESLTTLDPALSPSLPADKVRASRRDSTNGPHRVRSPAAGAGCACGCTSRAPTPTLRPYPGGPRRGPTRTGGGSSC